MAMSAMRMQYGVSNRHSGHGSWASAAAPASASAPAAAKMPGPRRKVSANNISAAAVRPAHTPANSAAANAL